MQQPIFNEQEWQMVLQLLQNERRELPSEIRHTDTIRFHDDLQQRMQMIDTMIERIREAVPTQSDA